MVSGSFSLPSRGSFHLSLTVLFSIGHWVVFSLTRWSSLLPTGFLVSRRTQDPFPASHNFTYGTLTPSGWPSQTIRLSCSVISEGPSTPDYSGLGSSLFARRYLGNRCFFLFLQVLRCFSSLGLSPLWLLIHHTVLAYDH